MVVFTQSFSWSCSFRQNECVPLLILCSHFDHKYSARRINYCNMPSNFLTMPPLASPNDVMDHNEHCNLVKAVEKPTLIDVVNGRGQGVHKHPGNEKYRKLVASNKVRNILEYVVGKACFYFLIR